MQESLQGEKPNTGQNKQTNKHTYAHAHWLTDSLTLCTHLCTKKYIPVPLLFCSWSSSWSTVSRCKESAGAAPAQLPPPPPSLHLTLLNTVFTLWTKISGKGVFNRIGSSPCERWGHIMTSDGVRVFVLRGDLPPGTQAVPLLWHWIKSVLCSGVFQAVVSSSTCSRGCRNYIATSYPTLCPSQLLRPFTYLRCTCYLLVLFC